MGWIDGADKRGIGGFVEMIWFTHYNDWISYIKDELERGRQINIFNIPKPIREIETDLKNMGIEIQITQLLTFEQRPGPTSHMIDCYGGYIIKRK